MSPVRQRGEHVRVHVEAVLGLDAAPPDHVPDRVRPVERQDRLVPTVGERGSSPGGTAHGLPTSPAAPGGSGRHPRGSRNGEASRRSRPPPGARAPAPPGPRFEARLPPASRRGGSRRRIEGTTKGRAAHGPSTMPLEGSGSAAAGGGSSCHSSSSRSLPRLRLKMATTAATIAAMNAIFMSFRRTRSSSLQSLRPSQPPLRPRGPGWT